MHSWHSPESQSPLTAYPSKGNVCIYESHVFGSRNRQRPVLDPTRELFEKAADFYLSLVLVPCRKTWRVYMYSMLHQYRAPIIRFMSNILPAIQYMQNEPAYDPKHPSPWFLGYALVYYAAHQQPKPSPSFRATQSRRPSKPCVPAYLW